MTIQRLAGKVALVTGAGRGFGAGIARGLGRAGASVCLVDLDTPELAETAVEIAADGTAVLTCPTDVGDPESMAAVVAEVVNQWQRIDLVVANAAIMPLVSFEETSPALWQRILDVNLTGVYNGVKAAWPYLLERGGHVIAIASGASVRGFRDEVAYCAAKHALEGFTKALAMEAETSHIAVNTMGPGKLIKPTSLTRADFAALPAEEQARYVDPLELAPAFVWLASQPPARFTGLRFDAGPLADAIAADGYDFAFSPERATIYVDDFVVRQTQRADWTRLPA